MLPLDPTVSLFRIGVTVSAALLPSTPRGKTKRHSSAQGTRWAGWDSAVPLLTSLWWLMALLFQSSMAPNAAVSGPLHSRILLPQLSSSPSSFNSGQRSLPEREREGFPDLQTKKAWHSLPSGPVGSAPQLHQEIHFLLCPSQFFFF